MEKDKIEYLIRYYLHLLPFDKKSELKYPYLKQFEIQQKELELSKLLLDKYSDKIIWNNCPNCKKLARTPKAKQCRYCNHDWH